MGDEEGWGGAGKRAKKRCENGGNNGWGGDRKGDLL